MLKETMKNLKRLYFTFKGILGVVLFFTKLQLTDIEVTRWF